MKKIFALALTLLAVTSICLSAAPKRKNVVDTGSFSLNTSTLKIYRPGTAAPVALALRPASINAKDFSWVDANIKPPYTAETNGDRTTVTAKGNGKCYDTVMKYVVVKGSPAMLVDMKYTANKDFHSQRGSAPSIDLPVELTKLTLPERDPIALVKGGKQTTFQLRTWALFSQEDPEKDAIMVIIPSLDDYDFSSGGRITCGAYTRGHGWRPGMDISHPDFQLTDFAVGDETSARVIFVFTNGKADCAKLFQEALKTFQAELEAE
ncbi:MAG: hypothetical protein J6S21_03125 [Victivallales bacterium]|nr:hypothetical protein [Victivallales bacterium]